MKTLVIDSPGRPAAGLAWLFVLALLVCSTQAAGWPRRLAQQSGSPGTKREYPDLWTAVNSEVWLMKQLNGEFKGKINTMDWVASPQFHSLVSAAQNPGLKATLFMPGSADAWQQVASYYCLTMQEWLDAIAGQPQLAAAYLRSFVVVRPLRSSDFSQDMELRTMQQTEAPGRPILTYKLGQKMIDGKEQWVLKNASFIPIPGTNDYEDVLVLPDKMDIKAGAAWFHQINSTIRHIEGEKFHIRMRAEVLQRAGWPANSTTCPPASGSGTATDTGKTVGLAVGVVAAALLLAGTLVLLLKIRSRHHGVILTDSSSLCGLMHRHQHQKGGDAAEGSSALPKAGPDSPGGGDGKKGVGNLSSAMLVPSSVAGSRLGVAPANAAAAACSYTASTASSMVQSSSSSSSAAHSATIKQLSQQQLQALLSVVQDDNSPFAMCPFSSQEASNMVMLVTQQSTSTTTGTPVQSSSSLQPRPTCSTSSGRMQTSDESGADTLGPLPTTKGQRGLYSGDEVDSQAASGSCDTQFRSYAGALVPSASMPMGQIPHALVIPLAELTLQELIGTGAEGKVYRGTWKHTDVAAKEYLPIPPSTDSDATAAAMTAEPGSPSTPPSDAARAHAQAALAKEVHWLTSLNHPNLVRFCAVCLERPLVIMEFYKHGSVFAMIRKAAAELGNAQPDSPNEQVYCSYLNWDRRLEMLHDVAAGMSYLHGRNHIHGDLRSPNLFVGADGKVKIGDFGFTKRLACNKASLKVARITHPRWVAPELIMENILSRASDVYSFGVIMYELLTFRIPFEALRKEQVVIEVMKGTRPEMPPQQELPPFSSSSTCLWSYIRLMESCWSQDAAERPSFEAIAGRLKAMQRWRMVINRLQQSECMAAHARRIRSMPAMTRPGIKHPLHPPTHPHAAAAAAPGAGVGAATAAAAGEEEAAVRRAVSAPPAVSPIAAGASGSASSSSAAELLRLPPSPVAAAALRSQGSRGLMPPPLLPSSLPPPTLPQQQQQQQGLRAWRGISSIPEVDAGEAAAEHDGMQSLQASLLSQAALIDNMSSLPVSSTVVHGTRLAIIGLPAQQDEQDALASVVDAKQIAEAKRVLLVASDLPSCYATQSLLDQAAGLGAKWFH